MSKTINLNFSYAELIDLYGFVCNHSDGIPELQMLQNKIDQKINKLIEHDLYTKYKTASTQTERDKARLEFLNRKGIITDFRY